MKTRIIGAFVALILAVGGAFALIVYVRGADARAADGAETTEIFIVQETIPEGTAGDGVAEFVKLDSVPVRNVAEGTVTDLDEIAGLVADADLLPGEQLLEARFIDPLELAARGEVPVPEGMQQVSFALPVQRMAGGLVKAGSTVGVVVTTPNSDPLRGLDTRFELDRVLVTNAAIGTIASSGGEDDPSTQQSGNMLMFTVALGTHDAERLVWALENAEKNPSVFGIWATLLNDATDTSGSAPSPEATRGRDPYLLVSRSAEYSPGSGLCSIGVLVTGEFLTFGRGSGGESRQGQAAYRDARAGAELRGDAAASSRRSP